jgi:hypothetical protein
VSPKYQTIQYLRSGGNKRQKENTVLVRSLGSNQEQMGPEPSRRPLAYTRYPTASPFEALIYTIETKTAKQSTKHCYGWLRSLTQPSVRLCVGHRRGRSNLRKFKKDAADGRPRYSTGTWYLRTQKAVERALHVKSYRQTPSFHHYTYRKVYVGNAYITRLLHRDTLAFDHETARMNG